MGEYLEIRRATHKDLTAIASLVEEAARPGTEIDAAEVRAWLFSKGLWVALAEGRPTAVAAWQAENLVSVTDVFYLSPGQRAAEAGSRLLSTIEAEAYTLMCEVSIVLVHGWAVEPIRSVLVQQGYEAKKIEELHRIWQEVLNDFVGDGPELMVKVLRERMVMVPV